MDTRAGVAFVAAALASVQVGETWARPPHSHHWTHTSPRPVAVYRPVRVIPRVVYFAAPVYYAPAPYYPPTSYYEAPGSYAAPASYYPAPAYSEPPPPPAQAPVPPAGPYSAEQALSYRYYCPDVRLYYPEIKECPAGWLTVLPGSRRPPN